MEIDGSTPEYLAFASFVANDLMAAIPPWPDSFFWPLVDALKWRDNARRSEVDLPGMVTAQCRLEQCIGAAVAAAEKRAEIAQRLVSGPEAELWQLIPSDDGMDDFCYHLVGLGQAFWDQLAHDPEPALQIARDHSYVESFRYVFEQAFERYPYQEYVRVLDLVDEIVPIYELRNPKPGWAIRLEDDMVGYLVRIDANTLHLATPLGFKDLPWP